MVPEPCQTCVICNSGHWAVDAGGTYYLNLPAPFAVAACQECGFRWLNPRPNAAEYEALYSEAYFSKTTGTARGPAGIDWLREFPPFEADYAEETLRIRARHFRDRLAMIARLRPAKGLLLDVGAGAGDFVARARDAGFDSLGLEPSPVACRMAEERNGVSLVCGDLFSYDAGNKRFDVVHLHHVFEHLLDPAAALERIRTLMHRDSLLIIEVPNQFENWPQKARQIKNGIKPLPRSLHSIHHPYFYTRRHVEALLSEHGFRVLRSTTYSLRRRLQVSTHIANVVLGLIGWMGNLVGGYGEDIEVVATLKR